MLSCNTKKVLVISASLRANSNSDCLAHAFADGARQAGCNVEELSLKGKELHYCIGCMSCMKTNRCVLKDDGNAMMQQVRSADILCFSTPVYYYEMSGQMKTFLDRMNPIYTAEYAFRDVYLLTCAAEDKEEVPGRAEKGLGGWIACFEKARYAGMVFAGGVSAPGEIKEHPALQEAFALGKNCLDHMPARKEQKYYIVAAESNSVRSGSMITGVTPIGTTLPADVHAVEQMLIDYAEEDGCGELDWRPCCGRIGRYAVTADAQMPDLKITMTYLLCDEQDLETCGITFPHLEELFRRACTHAGLSAEDTKDGALRFADIGSGNGRTFTQLRDTDPITYADMIRYLIRTDLNAENAPADYMEKLTVFLKEFTASVNLLRCLKPAAD